MQLGRNAGHDEMLAEQPAFSWILERIAFGKARRLQLGINAQVIGPDLTRFINLASGREARGEEAQIGRIPTIYDRAGRLTLRPGATG